MRRPPRARSARLAPLEPARQGAVGLLRPYHHRFPAVLALCEHRVGAGEVDNGHRIRVRNVDSRWPFGNQTEARMSWSWWRKKLASTSNCSTSCARTFSLTWVALDAVASISRVATEVTTRSRLRGKASSDVGHMSHSGRPAQSGEGRLQGCLSRCTPMRTREPHRSCGMSGRPGAGHEIQNTNF